MFKFHEFLVEKTKKNTKVKEPKTYHAFDLDNTLVSHDDTKLRIHVMDPNGNRVRSLTPTEYNNHSLPDDHKYDYSELASSEKFAQSSKPIRKMIAKLNAIQKKNKHVEIITARSDLDDKDKFAHSLRKHGIDIKKVHVRRTGNLEIKTHEAKKKVIHDEIVKNNYQRVHFYDDHPTNIDAVLSLKKHHPEVEFHGHHVIHDPNSGNLIINSRSV